VTTSAFWPQRWTFDEGMREISGFGGGYEASCRAMLKAGGEWADAHPDAIDWTIITRVSNLPQEMQDVMIAAAEPGGATGAMFGTVGSHICWVLRHSWEEWVHGLRRDLRQELDGGTELKRLG
jgi:hypothetical protein